MRVRLLFAAILCLVFAFSAWADDQDGQEAPTDKTRKAKKAYTMEEMVVTE